MSDFHGIIFAYSSSKDLGELCKTRTAASLPFCGRYRLIDFALSSMTNAGVLDCGVIMQRDYQSLLDHIGSGKDWDMGRRLGGLKLLPPFGLPGYHKGDYSGMIEALNAVSTYIKGLRAENIILLQGDLAANLDLRAIMSEHLKSGAGISAVCSRHTPEHEHYCYIPSEELFAESIVYKQGGKAEGLAALECYIIKKELLLSMMERCAEKGRYFFHSDAVKDYLAEGGRLKLYIHEGYARRIRSREEYFESNMDMLRPENRLSLFPAERPVRTKSHEDVSTYYGERASIKSSLVADGCIIEGDVSNSIIFSDVRIGKGASLKNCIVMRNGSIGENVILESVIADKNVEVSANETLLGSTRLPIIIPKNSKI